MSENKFKIIAPLAILILFVVLVVQSMIMWRQYRAIQVTDSTHAERARLMDTLANLRHRGPLTTVDVKYIENWMTFDYISAIYNVPSGLLKDQLKIADKRYPYISVARYASGARLNGGEVLNDVKRAVTTYLSTSVATSTTTSTATSTIKK